MVGRERDVTATESRLLLTHRSPHHAGPSGHARLPGFIPGARVIDGVRSRLPYRVRRRITPVPGSSLLYDSSSLAKEAGAMAAAARHPRSPGVIHYLDGERDVGLLPRVLAPTCWSTVASFHTPPTAIDQLPHRRSLSRLDAAIALGSNQLGVLGDLLDPARVHHVPYGVDTDYFCPGSGPSRGERVLFVGHHLRDFEVLAETADALRERFPDLALTAVTLPAARPQIPTRSWIECLSEVADASLRTAYREATLLLLPLRDAVACTALLEALACGLPAVVTDVGGVRDYVDQDCASLAVPGSAEALVESAAAVLEDDDRRAAMAVAARAKALEFSWPTIARRVERVYEQVQRV